MRTARSKRPFASRNSQHGIAMVEFVVGTPILFLVLYAICELGNAFIEYSTLVDSARDADRYLAGKALYGSTGVVVLTPPLIAETRNVVVYGNRAGFGRPLLPGLAPWQVSVFVDAANNVSVDIAYPYRSIVGGRIPYFVNRRSIDTSFLTLRAYTSMEAL